MVLVCVYTTLQTTKIQVGMGKSAVQSLDITFWRCRYNKLNLGKHQYKPWCDLQRRNCSFVPVYEWLDDNC